MATTKSSVIEITGINLEKLIVPIIGTSPLIINKFSEKAKQQMRLAMAGRKVPKQPKDPEAEYEAAFYRIGKPEDKRYGIPSICFKAAIVGAARLFTGITMTALNQCVFVGGVTGDDNFIMTEIFGTPEMREDVVRVARGGTDLRYRPVFPEWSATLDVIYAKSSITYDSVLSIIDTAGMACGVGEWRVQRGGTSGTWRVDPDRDVEILSVAR